MKENRINAIIALGTVLGAIVMLGALSLAIGKWSLSSHQHEIIIKFPNASGILANSEVRYAGAPAGRVKEVRLIPRAQQTIDPFTKRFNCVEVVAEVNPDIEIGEDVGSTIKQDGLGISAKYILLTPGMDHESKVLAEDAVLQGETPYDLTDLLQPAGETLAQARQLLTNLGPVMNRLDSLSETMQNSLPPLIGHTDKLVVDGDGVIANFNSPEGRQRLNDLMANLKIATENLKVVSYNAKALTATLAQKPWRVFWGGNVVQPPSESDDLKSTTVIRLKPSGAPNATTPAPAGSIENKQSP
jgi:phospholipid/cholesterol/gamma-HCH transport system substrate-binding protein